MASAANREYSDLLVRYPVLLGGTHSGMTWANPGHVPALIQAGPSRGSGFFTVFRFSKIPSWSRVGLYQSCIADRKLLYIRLENKSRTRLYYACDLQLSHEAVRSLKIRKRKLDPVYTTSGHNELGQRFILGSTDSFREKALNIQHEGYGLSAAVHAQNRFMCFLVFSVETRQKCPIFCSINLRSEYVPCRIFSNWLYLTTDVACNHAQGESQ